MIAKLSWLVIVGLVFLNVQKGIITFKLDTVFSYIHISRTWHG